jgi:nicotinamide-nucleotide amidase
MHEHNWAAILSIGDELTLGQSLDTNSRWLADRLTGMGIVTLEHATVPDERQAIAGALKRLMAGADVVVATGGLGPTADDLTRQALAEALGQSLVEDAVALGQIEAYFASRSRQMPAINRVQALRPGNARTLSNPHGTAPGLHARAGLRACDIFCLPGPPREMRPMFESLVVPQLRPPQGRAVRTLVLHTAGLGESQAAMRLGELMDRTRVPMVGTTASQAVVSCRIRYEGAAEGQRGLGPDALVAETAAAVRRRLDPYIFGEGDETLPGAVVDLLRAGGKRLSVVESCTGGMLGGMITEVPGASDVFVGGWITYANEQKERMVGVPASVFASGGSGAVSGECARAMAAGGLERSSADLCLSITGIAGPGGAAAGKPVGTVWVGLAARGGEVGAKRFLFGGSRASVREWSCKSALAMLRLHLLGRGELPLLGEQG